MAPKKAVVQPTRHSTRTTGGLDPHLEDREDQARYSDEESDLDAPRAGGFMADARRQSKSAPRQSKGKEKVGPSQRQDPIDEMLEDMEPAEFERVFARMSQLHQKRQRQQSDSPPARQPPPHRRPVEEPRHRRTTYLPVEVDPEIVKFHYNALNRAFMPTFEGRVDPLEAEKWLRQVEKKFLMQAVPDEVKPVLISSYLTGEAEEWWDSTAPVLAPAGQTITWKMFRAEFLDQYFPEAIRIRKMQEFKALRQGSLSVMEYFNRFKSLGRFDQTTMSSETAKKLAFKDGLNSQIRTMISTTRHATLKDMYEACLEAEEDVLRQRDIEQRRSRPAFVQREGSQYSGPQHSSGPPRPAGRGFGPSGSVAPSSRSQPVGLAPTVGSAPPPTCEHCGKKHSGTCFWKTGACFRCGQQGHKISECPQLPASERRDRSAGQSSVGSTRPRPNSKIMAMTEEEAVGAVDGFDSEEYSESEYLR